ncbi:hypothetical protein [Delftia lacustris]|uniref:hypothetical protein n=1 Tax=Delftia lacustris TaxID=558537 RepID=UPI0035A65B52
MLYIYPVFCEVIQLRRDGLRLAPKDWPSPVAGDLRMVYWDGQRNSLRRTLREYSLWVKEGTQMIPRLRLIDPIPVDVLGDAMLWRGMSSVYAQQGMCEFEQLWLLRPRFELDGPPLPHFDAEKFAPQLPEIVPPREQVKVSSQTEPGGGRAGIRR